MSQNQPPNMQPGNPYSGNSVHNSVPPSSSKSTVTIFIVLGALFGVMVVCCGLIGLLLPAVQAAREAARRMTCQNNEHLIALGILNYESAYGELPPAYTVDENGNKLHSWRTLILPFMEQQALYDQIDLTVAWDHPNNRVAYESVVPFYTCPSSPNTDPLHTNYFAIVTDRSALAPPKQELEENDFGTTPTGDRGVKLRDVIDGTSNTVLVVETSKPVHWMEPSDLNPREFIDHLYETPHHVGVTNIVMIDGSIKSLPDDTPIKDIEALVTKDGGESNSLQY